MHVRGLFRWLTRPQLLAGFMVLCLGIGAWNTGQRQLVASTLLVPPAIAQVKGAAYAPPVSADCTILPCVALTFDDGPDRRITPQVLDMLAREGIKATFFLVGREVPGKEDLVRRIYAEGHEIGNHTYNHPRLPSLSPTAIESEVNSTQAAIAHANVPLPEIMRPPYGEVTPLVRAHIQLPMVRWDVDTEDWLTEDQVKISEHLMHDVHSGAIILMHDKYQASVDALGPALGQLRQHYQFVTVSQLLDLSGGDQGQYFGRTR